MSLKHRASKIGAAVAFAVHRQAQRLTLAAVVAPGGVAALLWAWTAWGG